MSSERTGGRDYAWAADGEKTPENPPAEAIACRKIAKKRKLAEPTGG
jgi:hypothetical protein